MFWLIATVSAQLPAVFSLAARANGETHSGSGCFAAGSWRRNVTVTLRRCANGWSVSVRSRRSAAIDVRTMLDTANVEHINWLAVTLENSLTRYTEHLANLLRRSARLSRLLHSRGHQRLRPVLNLVRCTHQLERIVLATQNRGSENLAEQGEAADQSQ
jgi:hypothetical protein